MTPTGKRADSQCAFMQACRREPSAYTPIWLMRQAGRYQPEYRELRSKVSMLELCKTPELAAKVTVMAAEQLGVDAAIIFADILLITEAMGLDLQFTKGEGPVISNPVRNHADLARLRRPEPGELDYVCQALTSVRRALKSDVAVIGFAGSPFTVGSYIIEGGKSKNYVNTKKMMYTDPRAWHGLMGQLASATQDYLNAQIDAGADAVQLFDSWAGVLSPDDYRQYVMPYVKAIIDGINKAVPVINFATGNPSLLPLMKQAGGDVIGLDWRVDLAQAWEMLGEDVAVMGNLDPVVLYCPPPRIKAAAKVILDKAAGRSGHIFNLGHGIMPDMDPDNVKALVDAVHELSVR